MRKTAIFVEGQSEVIFLQRVLFKIFPPAEICFECFKLYAGQQQAIPYAYPVTNPLENALNASRYFLIINVSNDEGVLTAIREREARLFKQGFDMIIGLRDMYSQAYRKQSQSIDPGLNQKFMAGAESVIKTLTQPEKIRLHFAIMELEAWWLGMYKLFQKLDARLSPIFIETQLGYNLAQIDPQCDFFHPSLEVDRILRLADKSYRKHTEEVHAFVVKLMKATYYKPWKQTAVKAFKISTIP